MSRKKRVKNKGEMYDTWICKKLLDPVSFKILLVFNNDYDKDKDKDKEKDKDKHQILMLLILKMYFKCLWQLSTSAQKNNIDKDKGRIW